MQNLRLLAYAAVIALGSAMPAFAADANDPSNPNCSPGVKGCTANYPTSDISKDGPKASAGAMSPNCSPGEKGCTANYPTSDVSKKGPDKK
jgi:hypothetical protein